MNVARIVLIAILLLSLGFGQSTLDLLTRAESHVANKEYTAANEVLNQAITADPTFAPAMFLLGQILIIAGDIDQAGQYFRDAITADPGNEEFRAEYEKITEQISLMSEGNRYMNSGDLDDAYDTFSKVLEMNPNFTKAAYTMGGVNMMRKNYEQAIADFQKTLAINPEFTNAESAIKNVVGRKFNEGNDAYKKRDLDGALQAYKTVIQWDPTYYKAYYQIGVISARMRDYDGAIENYNIALEYEPTSTRVHFALGLAYQSLNNKTAALEAFQKTIDIDPTYAKAYSSMGEIYLDQQDYEKAVDRFTMAVSIDPTYAKAFENLGITYVKLENFEESIQQLVQATALDEKSYVSWYYLAHSYNQVGDCTNALDAAKNSIDIRQTYAPALIEEGVAYYCKGKGDKTRALNSLEKARNDSQWRKIAEYEIDRIKNPAKYEE